MTSNSWRRTVLIPIARREVGPEDKGRREANASRSPVVWQEAHESKRQFKPEENCAEEDTAAVLCMMAAAIAGEFGMTVDDSSAVLTSEEVVLSSSP